MGAHGPADTPQQACHSGGGPDAVRSRPVCSHPRLPWCSPTPTPAPHRRSVTSPLDLLPVVRSAPCALGVPWGRQAAESGAGAEVCPPGCWCAASLGVLASLTAARDMRAAMVGLTRCRNFRLNCDADSPSTRGRQCCGSRHSGTPAQGAHIVTTVCWRSNRHSCIAPLSPASQGCRPNLHRDRSRCF